jgi:hypothetical protein
MTEHDPSLLDQVKFCAALVLAWLGGEVGRLALAGAAGGLVRAFLSERIRIRDGVVSVVAGALMARYATPLMLVMLESYFGPLKGDVAGTAGFACGIAGMSLAKIIMAAVEAHGRRLTGGGGGHA